MANKVSFSEHSVVSCGTMRPELEKLRETGFLDAKKVLYTAPGLHEWPQELEAQLARRLDDGAKLSDNVIVVYGEKCFIDTHDPSRVTDTLIRERCPTAARVNASNCVDMLASKEERETIAGGERVYWLTPGWIQHWSFIFKDWDAAMANETFPQHDRAIVLDGIGFFDEYAGRFPERILAISDWMKLGIESHAVSLERLKRLLADCLRSR